MAPIPASNLLLNPDGSVYHLGLLPHHIGEIVITVGDPDRVDQVTAHFNSIAFETRNREFVTKTGTYGSRRITVLSTGIGTDNIELVMTELDALVNVDLRKREPLQEKRRLQIVRIGTSGSLQEDIPVGTHLYSDYAVGLDAMMAYYHLSMTEVEQALARDLHEKIQLPLRPYVVQCSPSLRDRIGVAMKPGNTVTAPGFFAPQGRSVRIPIRYSNLLGDMTAYRGSIGETVFRLTNFEMETAGYYAMARLLDHDALSVNAIIVSRAEGVVAPDPRKVVDDLIGEVLARL
ncbi:MAG TPA: nucleoside phosphorylase [Cyclobacteriaceae bacterium]|nr:nucleoside phosphorylase [Cyclobacteriaceae bacterium]